MMIERLIEIYKEGKLTMTLLTTDDVIKAYPWFRWGITNAPQYDADMQANAVNIVEGWLKTYANTVYNPPVNGRILTSLSDFSGILVALASWYPGFDLPLQNHLYIVNNTTKKTMLSSWEGALIRPHVLVSELASMTT